MIGRLRKSDLGRVGVSLGLKEGQYSLRFPSTALNRVSIFIFGFAACVDEDDESKLD